MKTMLLTAAIAAALALAGCSGTGGGLLGNGSRVVCDDQGCTTTLQTYVPFPKPATRTVARSYQTEK